MSVYGYLSCHDCRQTLWLGKALHDGHRLFAFHMGAAEEPAHWVRPQLNQAVWKFLADHTAHRIDVRLEHDMTDDMWSYRDIYDNRLEGYVAGWPGLIVGGSEL